MHEKYFFLSITKESLPFFFGLERATYILDATSLLQKVLVLSLANRNSTSGGGSTKTTKEKLLPFKPKEIALSTLRKFK